MRERKGLTLTRNAKYYSYGEVIYKRTNDIPFGYCGEYTDDESGLIYLRNRYYDPTTGGFLTEDPAKDGSNWYAYCAGNPVLFRDPLGLENVYIFYSKGDSSNKSLESRAIDEKNSKVKSGKTVYIKAITSEEQFFQEWAKMDNNGDKIESVSLYFHSNPFNLFINTDNNEYLTVDENRTGNLNINELDLKNISRINLYACNSAHQDYTLSNLAYGFFSSQNVDAVVGWDGSMKWSNNSSSGVPILAVNQYYFKSWCNDNNVIKRSPIGAVRYQKNAGKLYIYNSRGEIMKIYKDGVVDYSEFTERTA